MKLGTINTILNFFFIVLVLQYDKTGVEPTRLFLSTIFHRGYVYPWPHIKLFDRFGF